MPFYEYECQSCKFYTEVMQKISDPPLAKCPSCGKRTLKKLVSAPVFRLKGSGWYETDFKSEKEAKRNLAAEREESKPAEAAESKPEAKPAAPEPAAKPAEPKPAAISTTGSAVAPTRRAAAASRPAATLKARTRSGASRAKPAAKRPAGAKSKRKSRR
jgi:putative FmdB family regulatory protein